MDFFELILRNKPDNNRLNHDGNIYDPFNVLSVIWDVKKHLTRSLYVGAFIYLDFSCIQELMWIRVDPMWVLFSSTTPSG